MPLTLTRRPGCCWLDTPGGKHTSSSTWALRCRWWCRWWGHGTGSPRWCWRTGCWRSQRIFPSLVRWWSVGSDSSCTIEANTPPPADRLFLLYKPWNYSRRRFPLWWESWISPPAAPRTCPASHDSWGCPGRGWGSAGSRCIPCKWRGRSESSGRWWTCRKPRRCQCTLTMTTWSDAIFKKVSSNHISDSSKHVIHLPKRQCGIHKCLALLPKPEQACFIPGCLACAPQSIMLRASRPANHTVFRMMKQRKAISLLCPVWRS